MSGPAIGPGTVVGIRYDLYDVQGGAQDAMRTRVESNRDGDPVLFLFGARSVLAALQDALAGRCAGDNLSVTIPHGRAYGRHYPERVTRVSAKLLAQHRPRRTRPASFTPGERVRIPFEGGTRIGTVLKAGKFNIDVDLNHPLAGRDLAFDIRIESVREASAEEIAHGHAHGAGGHQHA